MIPKIFTVIDLETTGPIADESFVIDIGILRVENGKVVKTYDSLVKPTVPIPKSITYLTGITDEEVKNAPTFREIISEIEPLFQDAVFTAHNAPFDYGFTALEFLRCGREFIHPILCTKDLAHRIFPEKQKLGLDALALDYGIEAPVRHRAFPDAELTAKVLLEFLKIENIAPVFNRVLIPKIENPVKIPAGLHIQSLSQGPGVYRFVGERERVLYVGSAANLHSKASVHFIAQVESKKERELCQSTKKIETAACASELEARIAAAREIRDRKPKFNKILNDWYPGAYLWVTREPFPQLAIESDPPHHGDYEVIGPFLNVKFLEKLVEFAKGVFHLCDLRISKRPRRNRFPSKRPCGGMAVQRCRGACVGEMTPEAYQKHVSDALEFIKTPLDPDFEKNEEFMRIFSDRRHEKLGGGWKTKRILKKYLKQIREVSRLAGQAAAREDVFERLVAQEYLLGQAVNAPNEL